MSNISATIECVLSVEPHPNAERLEVARVLGTQTIVPKGQYHAGDMVVFFPPDICIPEIVSLELGVLKYLKHAIYEGKKIKRRVAACRIRGLASYGFIIPVPWNLRHGHPGSDVSGYYGAVKYEPPNEDAHCFQGDCAPDHPSFHKYTDIQHYWKYPGAIKPGTLVRVTEKIHGTNSRIGVVMYDGKFLPIAGSNKANRKQYDSSGKLSLYWRPLHEFPQIAKMIESLSEDTKSVIVFGEIFGPRVQDLDYGVRGGGIGYRVFDISVDGRYLNWLELIHTTSSHCVDLVPLLYLGPWNPSKLSDLTDGRSIVSESVSSKFRGREGCVITPQVEAHDETIGRVILKSVSADYLDRKGARDN